MTHSTSFSHSSTDSWAAAAATTSTTTITVSWPLYSSICVSHHPKLRIGGFLEQLFTAHKLSLTQQVHSDLREDARVKVRGATYTVSAPSHTVTSTSVFRTYIYPYMPFLDPHTARFHERRISSVMFTSTHLYSNVYMPVGVAALWPIRPIFGLDFGKQSSQKWEIPCLGCWWTAVQNFTPLALSSAKKSVTVQTNKHTNKQ